MNHEVTTYLRLLEFNETLTEVVGILQAQIVCYDAWSSSVCESAVRQMKTCLALKYYFYLRT